MNCTVCGAVVPDGSSVCPMCGANLIQFQQPNQAGNQQPMGQPNQGFNQQPMGQPNQGFNQQPMGQPNQGFNQQPMGQPNQGFNQQPGYGQPMGGFGQTVNNGFGNFTNGSFDLMIILGIVGGFLLFIVPFFKWFKMEFNEFFVSYTIKGNLFNLGGLSVFFGLLIMLAGVFIILWNLAGIIPQLNALKQKFSNIPLEIIVLGVTLLIIILAFALTGVGKISVLGESIKIKELKTEGIDYSHSAGPIFAFIGWALAAVPTITKFIKKN